MSNKQLRQAIRYAHLLAGSLIIAYIYSSSLQASTAYTGLIQFFVVPAIIISGILLWQQARVNKLRKRLFSSSQA